MPSNFSLDNGKNRIKKGVLYIVATPIGNLEDITFRAVRVLAGVDLVAAEDTRTTGRLLSYYGIGTKLVSYHEHNEEKKAAKLVEKLKSGLAIALVSDAGTPSVSDPGYRLVKKAISDGIVVVPVPGASAVLAALTASGLPTDTFVFYGFLPKKKGRRRKLLESFPADKTAVIYESPKRIQKCLEEIFEILGEREAVLCRELTKLHEEFIRGSLSEIIADVGDRNILKGECTLLVAGKKPEVVSDDIISEEIRSALINKKMKPSLLAREIAEKFSVSKNKVYDEIQRIRSDEGSEDTAR